MMLHRTHRSQKQTFPSSIKSTETTMKNTTILCILAVATLAINAHAYAFSNQNDRLASAFQQDMRQNLQKRVAFLQVRGTSAKKRSDAATFDNSALKEMLETSAYSRWSPSTSAQEQPGNRPLAFLDPSVLENNLRP